MKIVTVIGARPQFIKAAIFSKELKKKNNLKEVLIHTGQHFNSNMSQIFFDELDIPIPDYNLGINSLSQGAMTGRQIEQIEKILMLEIPDWLVLYGDTNSTLAGAIAASKLNIPIVHIEAGLRSYDKMMPEEVNRTITDHLSSKLFCPSEVSQKNLGKEGIVEQVYNVGDIMYDIFMHFKSKFINKNIYGDYALLTLHRQENTNKKSIINRLNQVGDLREKLIFPLHPRTRITLKNHSISLPSNIKVIEPVGWLELMGLIKFSKFILTDSGGIQKEAFWHKKQCLTLRNQTEWIETVHQGANTLFNEKDILKINNNEIDFTNPYGDGNACQKIIEELI